MLVRRNDLTGIDDRIAERALARRARQRQMAESAWCGRRFTHPRLPTQYDELGYLAVEICVCVRPGDHERECFCAHGVERFVYRVDRDGRKHYATRPLIR